MKAFGMLQSFTRIYSVMIAVVQIIIGRWKKLLSGMPVILMALNHARCDSSNSNRAIAGYSHN